MFKAYRRLQQFTSRIIFKLLFAHRFKTFGRKTILVSPDKIEGEEYIQWLGYWHLNKVMLSQDS
jgi:hypothetical protein